MNFTKSIKTLLLTVCLVLSIGISAQPKKPIVTGAEQTAAYTKLLKGKKVGYVGNQTSVIGKDHAVDYLLSKGVNITKVFAPEHGFRDMAAAGAKIADGVDTQTGLPVISLYGKNYKPSKEMLEGLDVIIYDIQDVGLRFYTYISTMTYVMEAAAENGIPVIILDRPNPNGHYVDGNILDPAFKSFVGMHPVPIVYGMTAGEYAKMVNGEGWLKDGVKCKLTVIPCLNYDHSMHYSLPVPPSPNLATANAVAQYANICYFEGTPLSEGRGSEAPFEMFGSPKLPATGFTFTPNSSKNNGVLCNGVDLRTAPATNYVDLKYVIWAYENYSEKDKFFNKFFDTLCGGTTIREQIVSGMDAEQIRATWTKGLEGFMPMRAKYLLYKDFK